MRVVVAEEEAGLVRTPLWIPVAALAAGAALLALFLVRGAPAGVLAVCGLFVLAGVGGTVAVLIAQRERRAFGAFRLSIPGSPRLGGGLSARLEVPYQVQAVEARFVLTEIRYDADGQVVDPRELWERKATYPATLLPEGRVVEIEVAVPSSLPPTDDPGAHSHAVTVGARYRRWRLEVRAQVAERTLRRTYDITVKPPS